jgi:choline dehydrogenase-like flavoprotein
VIVEGAEHTTPLALRTHTLVVGSGSGGAVVAAILAEAGVELVVLEEGGRFEAKDFTQRDDEMYPALYRDGGQQTTSDGLVNVLQGSVLGGSTVVNTADCTPIPPAVYAHWRRLLGLTALDEDALAPSEQRVFASLKVNPITPSQVNANNAKLLEGAHKLGLEAGTFLHNRVGCVGSGYCLVGCAYDAKLGAHLTYLPRAVAAGAAVYTDTRVERIALRDPARADGGFVVTGAIVERASRVARLPLRIEAARVVLAAGAVHSPAILAASGFAAKLPQIGRNLSLQPQMPVTAVFRDRGAIVAWRGIPQSAYCSEFDDGTAEHGLGGYRLEGISGGMSQLGVLLPGFGDAHKQAMFRIDRTALSLLLVPDRPSGSIAFEPVPPRGFRVHIDYVLQREWQERLRRGLRTAAEIYFAAGAEQVGFASEIFPPLRSPNELDRLEGFPIRTGLTRLVSAHVQGSCRMSLDARTGVVDQDHRVHGVPGLYVVDASVMPTTAATHTMIPVMTLADRAAQRMLEADA